MTAMFYFSEKKNRRRKKTTILHRTIVCVVDMNFLIFLHFQKLEEKFNANQAQKVQLQGFKVNISLPSFLSGLAISLKLSRLHFYASSCQSGTNSTAARTLKILDGNLITVVN